MKRVAVRPGYHDAKSLSVQFRPDHVEVFSKPVCDVGSRDVVGQNLAAFVLDRHVIGEIEWYLGIRPPVLRQGGQRSLAVWIEVACANRPTVSLRNTPESGVFQKRKAILEKGRDDVTAARLVTGGLVA
jgi:hypothetical protein